MLIRTARERDAEALLRLLGRLDEETHFMMYERDERSTEICEQEKLLRSILSGGGTVLLAKEGDRLVGFLEAARGVFRRNRHVVGLVVGVLGDRSGRGIGSDLMDEAERWARGH